MNFVNNFREWFRRDSISEHQQSKKEIEADKKFSFWQDKDPFPSIDSALLNSADIVNYVETTGMIYPFYPDKENEKLKPASYEINLLGLCVYWDENGKEKEVNLEKGMTFKLPPNSIAFVTLEPTFRIPKYIALRFNLKITHVYRGLLLGTGPLVDPGFQGKLSIPLHNLTTNEYIFKGGEGLIWMEFTKLSYNEAWSEVEIRRKKKGSYVSFPIRKYKEYKNVKDYLKKADPVLERPIRSSIPKVTVEAQKSAQDAANTITQIRAVGFVSLLLAIIALGVSILLGIPAILSYFQDTSNYIYQARNDLKPLKDQQGQIDCLKRQVQFLSKQRLSKSKDKLPDCS
jgi:deoxycytidine triphosphate deaminase